jgi:hypothetical protein
MRKRDLQNREFDKIGRDLFEATKPSAEQIEKLVTAPQLFDAVKARIKADEQSRRKPHGFFGDRAAPFFWNRRTAAAVFIFLALGAALIIFKTPDSPPQTAGQIIEPEMNAPGAENEKPFSLEEKKYPAIESRGKSDRAAFTPKTPKTPRRGRKLNPAKAAQTAEKTAPEIFYSLASAGNWEATGEDLQIVRAELSRSELFALGVHLPVENETGKIKTDLLVGSDGTAKAIRFVEKF